MIREQSDEVVDGHRVHPVQWTGLPGEAEIGGVTADGPGAGVGVTDPEEGVALTLDQMVGGDPGSIVRGGVEQRPPRGVETEWSGILGSGDRPQGDGLAVPDVDAAALRPDDPPERVGDDLGPHLVRHPHRENLPGEAVGVPVPQTFELNPPDEGGGGGTVEADVEEPGPGDLDPGNAFGPGQIPPKHLGNPKRWPPGRPGELQSDVGGVVPPPPGPRRRDHGPLRNAHAELSVLHSTTHRAQHGTGELDGSHGTSVGEEGGG